MSKINLRNNIIKKNKEVIEEKEEDLEYIEIPEYFKEGEDLAFSATLNGDTRTNTFFMHLLLGIIIFGIVFAFCYIVFGASFILTVKAWIHQIYNAIKI